VPGHVAIYSKFTMVHVDLISTEYSTTGIQSAVDSIDLNLAYTSSILLECTQLYLVYLLYELVLDLVELNLVADGYVWILWFSRRGAPVVLCCIPTQAASPPRRRPPSLSSPARFDACPRI
jgi:hypothetical protein